ncbi:MAG: TadE/TadG family type IV pilus assembly protein [Sulfitobacter sp.]
MRPRHVRTRLAGFGKSEAGSALVEFALAVPLCLVFFAIAIEGARTFWAYQTVISGVRDAARFVGRATPNNICTVGGSLSDLDAKITQIVRDTREGNTLFPASITVTSVFSSLTCITDDFRLDQTPIATVTATLTIDYPFAPIMGLFGAAQTTVTTEVSDSSRVFGA